MAGTDTLRYLLDTNVLSDLVRHPQGAVAKRISRSGEDSICTSVVVAAELRYGAAKKASARLHETIEALLDTLTILPLDVDATAHYASIRCELEAAGTPIGANDLLIAAQARSLGITLITANLGEFERVRGLKVKNWL